MSVENVTEFVKELEELQEKGLEAIPTKPLIEHLKLISQPSDLSPEDLRTDWKMRHEINLESYRADTDSNGRMFDATIALAGMALKSAMLINGGAAVAMLAYLGNVAGKQIDVGNIPGALCYFIFGVLATAIGTGFGYLCQATYSEGHPKWGLWLRVVSALLIVSSYALFGLGGSIAYEAFKP